MAFIYTGIGSRAAKELPEVMTKLEAVGTTMANLGCILRSGGADGADLAFENGHRNVTEENLEIYLPWKGFNKEVRPSNHNDHWELCEYAKDMAISIHPKWEALSHGGRKLHTRNIYQMLGKTLDKPSNMLLCWTVDGKIAGGSRTAIYVALNNNVPVINLNDEEWSRFTTEEFLAIISRYVTTFKE